MTFVIIANAIAVALGVGLLFVVMRTGYQVAGRTPVVARESTPLHLEPRETLERAA
jgi:hypothetical protein